MAVHIVNESKQLYFYLFFRISNLDLIFYLFMATAYDYRLFYKFKMADPKYANLPGIAHDQPDIYETDDLPECDLHQDEPEEMSESVETLHITASDAFGKFKGKSGPAKVEYELAGTGSSAAGTETPLQKYQRLNCEVRELLEEIDAAKCQATEKASSEKHAHSLVGIATQTNQLQDQLSKLKLEEMLGSSLVKKLDDPRGNAKEKLMSQLQAVSEPTNGGKVKSKSTNDDDSKVMYELLMKPNVASFEDHVQIAEMEKRLDSLEKVIAASPDKMSTLSIETNQKNVFGAVDVLNTKLSMLNPSNLDHIEGRLAALLQKMNSVVDQKGVVEDAEKQGKIEELYDLCVKGDANSVVLSDVVDRLDALQSLHENALQFTKAISQLDTVQQKLEMNLSGNGAMLKETQTKFQENILNIQNNFDNLEKRIDNLK